MSGTLSTVTPKLFLKCSPQVVFETYPDGSLNAGHLRSFLNTVMSEGAIGISASYRHNCQLSAIAFSSPSRALVVQLTKGGSSLSNNHGKKKRFIQARSLLQEHILCNENYQKYAFKMDRIAIALYLDLGLRIDNAVDMLSVSTADRRSLQALMNAMGGELTVRKSNVEALFFSNESGSVSNSDLVQQAWAACQAAIIPRMAELFHVLRRIRTNTMQEKHMAVLAKICRDGERSESLKPHTVKNDVMKGIKAKKDKVTLICNRFPTRVRKSTQQFLRIETRNGVQVKGRAVQVEGRQAQVLLSSSLRGSEIKSVTTVGKADLTSAEACREDAILAVLKGEPVLLSQPFFKAIWLPKGPASWPPTAHTKSKIPTCCPKLEVNTSQERAIEKILSASDKNRVVLIQGPPGTGKTTVITVAVTSIISCSAASRRTIWIAAQSNVAVKNIAEKFDKVDFHDFKLLVSMEFHFDWHEHLYERLAPCVIRSDSFSKSVVGASRQLCGARVILCTLSMLSNDHIAPYVQVNPVDILIFDEGSQIEVGNYVPVLHRFGRTLSKIAFIGDQKQHRMPNAVGDFISQKVYNGKLKTCHPNTVSLPCRFVNVERGQEKQLGKSWTNPLEARVVVRLAGVCQAKGLDFRIITPYDAQRSLIERELQSAGLSHEDKVFNVDSFQGNEAEHIIISVVRSDKLGFLNNQRRTNVMLTRCKKTMDICTSRAFIWGSAESTLIGKLAAALGPQAWVDGDVQSITALQGTIPPLLHTAGSHAPASSSVSHNHSSTSRSRGQNTSKRTHGSRSYKT
ncbi:P-loop containing nucleoside triphosphate hydrolase protein [Pisolithus sp. B1]|nr:P-loop containing nucleoside triphosphate hydrolase protein [Pisolithus sp. B1]